MTPQDNREQSLRELIADELVIYCHDNVADRGETINGILDVVIQALPIMDRTISGTEVRMNISQARYRNMVVAILESAKNAKI